MRFIDRADAGRQLAARLRDLRTECPVVLGLPRGGVPVAFEVARELGAPLDVVAPVRSAEPGPDERRLTAPGGELERRAQRYRKGRPPIPLVGRTAVVVDDAAATGCTVRAAHRAVRALGAGHVVVAVPVCPARAAHELRLDAVELVCLEEPWYFDAVGHWHWYANFCPVGETEVADLLARAAAAHHRPPRRTTTGPEGS